MLDEASLAFDGQCFHAELRRRNKADHLENVKKELMTPTPMRVWAVAKAFNTGLSVDDVHKLTSIDVWFLANCNPETVSTDHDESDRLYFEELSLETVRDIVGMEDPGGDVVSVEGQTPNNLAMKLHQAGAKLIGTSVEAIDACENRFKFSKLCDSLRIDQPEWLQFTTLDEAF
jgi:carbamoylphosphate synthase large subunit